jgi:hypothetical protein
MIPQYSRSDSIQPAPFFVHAPDCVDLVIHRQTEKHREHDDRQECINRTSAGQAEQRAAPALRKHGGNRTDGGRDGQQIQHGRDERNQQTAEYRGQQNKCQHHYDGDKKRRLTSEHRGNVDTGSGLTANVHGKTAAPLGGRDQIVAQGVYQPAGLAGLRPGRWIYEKFQSKTDNHGLLPRSWIEDTYTNLIHYGEADKGGHFAAFEQPEILINEIRTGLRSLRS